ncbi:hypothetical protein ACB098_12G008000 [Castanea mollissima]
MDQNVVKLLTDNIISILSTEAPLLWGTRDAIEDIKDELISMQLFLVDADRKGVGSEGEKNWVAIFMYHMNRQRIGGQYSWILHHSIYFPKNLWGAILERNQRYDNQKWVKRKLIMDWLMDGEPHLTVISIVGMGGSGKTTLAANIYNNEDVKKHFDCYMLRSLIKEFHESRKETNPADLNSMNYRLLVKTLVNYLEKKRIILTTRKEDDVACHQMGGKHHIHKMELLLTEEAWELFCKKAFSSSPNGSCPPELKSFAQELVGKCDGLPLAIAALGSLMYSKNMSEWNKIYNNLSWSLSKNPKLEAVKSILLLSFNDLPYQLKHCFLYCSLFPEDHEIQRNRLIKLWMAEGFVEQDKRSMPEEVAESYLLELIFRSMLQVVERNEFGRPKRCKMHDILRELALPISEREKIGVVHVGREEMTDCEARRISIHKTDGEVKSFMGMSKLRSFLVFNKLLKTLPSRSKMLRVLDLEDAPIDELPDEVFKLFNLRYSNLRGTLLKKLPNSIGRLLNLQTLDIMDTQIKALPHGIGKLKNLQAVTYLEIKGDLLKQIRSMTQLTSIVLSNVKAVDEMDLCDSIHNMKVMRYLCVMVTNAEETLRMDAPLSPPTNLQKLVLAGKLEKVPLWFHSLQSLTYLYLHWSRLEEDLLPQIAALPHLRRLALTNAYVGKQLCFSTGFLKFTSLGIRNFPQLNEIIIEKGVMPNLKSLYIISCMQLNTVPKGIEYLQNLQELILEFVLMELQNRIEGEGSVDFPKVQHIPNIYIR